MNIPGIGTRFSTGVAFIVMAMLGCLSVLTQADAEAPTAEQLKLFRQLPAAQQHELLKSLDDKPALKKAAQDKFAAGSICS